LGIPAERCVVFEDAPAGIEAGLAAGARVIAVASTHPKAELSRATAIVERLADVQLTIHHGNGYKLTVRLPMAG
jgi:sugar-phosphatase